jgi:hypothetical protein
MSLTFDQGLATVVAAFITAVFSIFLAFHQYKKGKQLQTIEHENRLEYDYSVDLRKRRLKTYVSLWELTDVKVDENSHRHHLTRYKDDLSYWYYYKGNGMLLTEASQKLFYAFKEEIGNLADKWNKLYNEEEIRTEQSDILEKINQLDAKIKKLEQGNPTLNKGKIIDKLKESSTLNKEKDNDDIEISKMLVGLRKKLGLNWDKLNEIEKTGTFLRYREVKRIKSMASGLRTALLRDVGTRGELTNLPIYNELFVNEPKEHDGRLEVEYRFLGNNAVVLKNKQIILQIINLDNNILVDVVVKKYNIKLKRKVKLEPGDFGTFELENKKLMECGNYSARIVADVIVNNREFLIISEKAFKYPLD